jgi:hypothetical protein
MCSFNWLDFIDAYRNLSPLSSYRPGSYAISSLNFGSYHLGSYNFGSYNFGSYNFGSYNFGSYNFGSYNFGSYNLGSYNPESLPISNNCQLSIVNCTLRQEPLNLFGYGIDLI